MALFINSNQAVAIAVEGNANHTTLRTFGTQCLRMSGTTAVVDVAPAGLGMTNIGTNLQCLHHRRHHRASGTVGAINQNVASAKTGEAQAAGEGCHITLRNVWRYRIDANRLKSRHCIT